MWRRKGHHCKTRTPICVIRRYDCFASDDWKLRLRESMLALIESYSDIVLEVNENTVDGLWKSGSGKSFNW